MKRFLLLICFIISTTTLLKAQTGNGIIAQVNSPFTFNPTTVDSTSTISVQFNNTVGITNLVSFSGLSGPFSISNDSIWENLFL